MKRIKDPGSSITHFVGIILTVIAGAPLFLRAGQDMQWERVISALIFWFSMLALYTASTVYHTFDISEHANRVLRKIDHMMISVLIAGTYTPVCLLVLQKPFGYYLLGLVWGFAIINILINAFWITCPKWFSSVMYICMGWICILAMKQILENLSAGSFLLLLCGGILYTVGGVIYALKLPAFNRLHENFGSHEIFHIFVLLGSACHYFFVCALL